MIQLNEHALFMCYPDGRVEPLDLTQLVGEIAAQTDGLSAKLEPWMVEHVVQSIIHYLRNDLKKDSVTLEDFVNLSNEILSNFMQSRRPDSPFVCDLYQLAQKAGYGFELQFFHFLRDTMQAACGGTRPTEYVFTGLRRCVKFLAGGQRWRNRCRHIHDDIVRFIRETAERTGSSNVSLSVR